MFETQHEDNEKFKAAQKELRKSNSEILKRNTDFLEGLRKKESQIIDKNETTPVFDPSVATNQVQDFNLEPEFDVMPLPGHFSLDPANTKYPSLSYKLRRQPLTVATNRNFTIDVEPQCPTCNAPLSDEVDLGPAYEKQSAGSMQGIARQKEDYQILRDKQME